MKKFLISACILSIMILLTACNRGERNLIGDYSYKLSGDVILTDADGQETHHFIHRNGQMNVLKDKSRKSGLLITMNEMNGGCYTIMADIQGDTIVLSPYEFSTNIIVADDFPSIGSDNNTSLVYRVRASGSGRCNDQILILCEQWSGTQSGDASVTLRGPEMTILAEKN